MAQALDPFRLTDKLDPNALEVMITRLEARGGHPNFAGPLSAYLDRMEIDDKANVLDLGCGTGVAARAIAQRPGFGGSVLGIDLSDYLVDAAKRLAEREKLSDRVRFEAGDSRALGLQSGSLDAVVAHTLFSHLDDPPRTLAEMRRLLPQGASACIFDGDYASMTFELSDERRSRHMDDAIVASLVTNPRILRQLPRLLKQAGFVIETVIPSIIAEIGGADFWRSGIEAYAKLAPRAGIVDEAEASSWLDELLAASAAGEFFGCCVYYAYIARAV
ncbi:methyltransferase domain-containing protein [Mesorhizobium tianshanense]|nr:methyltransferase domain-containing protein [Mesorhizobium tianshanense]